MRLYGLCKTGSLGVLDRRGGHRFRRYRRLWPRREILRLLASFAKGPAYSFNEACQMQRRAVLWSNPKLLIPHQSAHQYFM
jgi:hypothetical protein